VVQQGYNNKGTIKMPNQIASPRAHSASWVIIHKDTGKVIAETYSKTIACLINTNIYEALPIIDYLGGFNARIKQQAKKVAA
jgi:hypothetical protein